MKLARPNYFQGILQLRNINEDILSFVKDQIRNRQDVLVARTVNFPDGVDLYITSQKYIRIIGKKLKDKFGGELKISSKLHTRNRQGKDLFRINVLYKSPKHRTGDIVTVRGDEVRLIKIGKKIFAKDMKTGRRLVIRGKDLPQD